ncbi:hypothetical protein MUK42_37791 [Musa troglodytarum]|uniref:Uncharacterized protein n=1 Tax=Musa troglodytarum TaxID=320322 RepID=A0A9E7GGC0_9LILI|nr:hypothetical protein MUK42_37791 [Musa troglodytarum]
MRCERCTPGGGKPSFQEILTSDSIPPRKPVSLHQSVGVGLIPSNLVVSEAAPFGRGGTAPVISVFDASRGTIKISKEMLSMDSGTIHAHCYRNI